MLIQFVVVLFLVRLIFRGFASLGVRRPGGPSAPPPTTDLVFDSVCNTYLPRDRALVAMVSGREQHFCSPECRAKAALRLNPVS